MVGERVLVTGAAGFLGRELVRQLAEAGSLPVGLVRRAETADAVRRAGGEPVVGSVARPDDLLPAVRGCTASVLLASAANNPEVSERDAHQLREEGARNLVRASAAAGVRRVLIVSGYWVYPDHAGPITEATPAAPAGEAAANFAAETAALAARTPDGPEVVIARPAMVYGDGAWCAATAAALRAGEYRLIDNGTNTWSFVSLTDTAAAFRTLLRGEAAPGIYNVADGASSSWGALARFLAEKLGRPAPPSMSRADALAAYGEVLTRHLTANRDLSADKLRALGWVPRYRSYRDGLAPLMGWH